MAKADLLRNGIKFSFTPHYGQKTRLSDAVAANVASEPVFIEALAYTNVCLK